MQQLSEEERHRQLEAELAANEAAERESKRKLTRNLIIIFGVIIVAIGSYLIFHEDGEPEVYYTDGNIDYVKQADKLRRTSGFKEVYAFRAGYAVVGDGKKYGVVDVKGNVICPVKYDAIESNYSEHYPDMCQVRNDSLFGLVDKQGNEVLAPIYDEIGPISNGEMVVRKGKEEFIANTEGKVTPREKE